jgi:iron transport multicopper oxidase
MPDTGKIYLDEFDLKPYDGTTAPDHYDREFTLVVDFFEDPEDVRRGSFNRTPFFLPDHKPLLMTFLDGEELPANAMTLEVGHMEVVQIVINNPFYGPHPFHLHGHHFWVMGNGPINDGDYDPERHKLSLNGPKRDTIFVHELSWGVMRFVADNPGIWTFHCHIDWHLLSGMALVILEARELATQIQIPDEAKRVCGLFEE